MGGGARIRTPAPGLGESCDREAGREHAVPPRKWRRRRRHGRPRGENQPASHGNRALGGGVPPVLPAPSHGALRSLGGGGFSWEGPYPSGAPMILPVGSPFCFAFAGAWPLCGVSSSPALLRPSSVLGPSPSPTIRQGARGAVSDPPRLPSVAGPSPMPAAAPRGHPAPSPSPPSPGPQGPGAQLRGVNGKVFLLPAGPEEEALQEAPGAEPREEEAAPDCGGSGGRGADHRAPPQEAIVSLPEGPGCGPGRGGARLSLA